MKRLTMLMITLLLSTAFASPLEDLMGVLGPLCGAEVPEALVGGADTQKTLCSVLDVIERGDALIDSAEQGSAEFLDKAFDEAFAVLQDYTPLDTSLEAVAAFRTELNGLAADGFSLEASLAFVSQQAKASRLAELFAPSTEEAGTLQRALEDSERINPGVLQAELATLDKVTDVQAKTGRSADLAAESIGVATSAMGRGDEAALTLNVTSPDPLNRGIADTLQDRAENTVSTRSAVQLMLDYQAQASRQQASETTSLLTSIKEMSYQQALSNQQLSLIASQAYAEHLEEANTWRAEHKQAVEEAYLDAQDLQAQFDTLSAVLEGTANQLSGVEAE